MPIINFNHNKADAPSNATWCDYNRVWVWKTHVGLCLREREVNRYDDSDFYMTVWDVDAAQPKEIMFATTRGWSYPSFGSSVDATPDIVALYAAWLKNREAEKRKRARHTRAIVLMQQRRDLKAACAQFGANYWRLVSLRRNDDFQELLRLFNPRVRSGFKRSLREQVIAWSKDTSARFAHPLSNRQRACLK